MRRSVYLAASALLAAVALFSVASPASAAGLSAVPALGASSASIAESWSGPVGLTVGRIFGAGSHGDIINFSSSAPSVTSVGGSVFGVDFAEPLTAKASSDEPTAFATFSTGSSATDATRIAAGAVDAQTVGVRFGLQGGNGTIALQSSGASFGSGAYGQYASQGPAVFAFYNFPKPQAKFSLGSAFGLGGQTGGALAADLGPAQLQGASAATGAISSPLISSLSAQGPFWFGRYAPATRGSSLQLNFPFKLARIPVKLRLGEQAMTDVQPSSLATEILGPAFASSAGSTYKALSGGVTLALPLLNRRATVSLDGLYETLQHGDKTPFGLTPYGARAETGLAVPGPSTVVYYPNFADLQQYIGAASVALPVTRSLTVNGRISEQTYGGVALDTLTQSLNQHKTAYGGGVVYNFPKTNSSINLFFNKDVYTDDNLPTYNFTQNQQNLGFSVKF